MSDTLGRYAPGDYTCRCTGCSKEFTGDKRATTCLKCAGQEQFNAGMERAAEIIEQFKGPVHHSVVKMLTEEIRKEIES